MGKAEAAPSEHQEQVLVVNWMDITHPSEARFLAAVPNGANKSRASQARFKKEGLRAGYPDLLLDLPRGPYHGMRIEMKRKARSLSKVSDDQYVWKVRLEDQGYYTVMCYGHAEAEAEITQYLNQGPFDVLAYLEMWYGIEPYTRDELVEVLGRIYEQEES